MDKGYLLVPREPKIPQEKKIQKDQDPITCSNGFRYSLKIVDHDFFPLEGLTRLLNYKPL